MATKLFFLRSPGHDPSVTNGERPRFRWYGRCSWTFSAGGVFTATAPYNLPTLTSIISWSGQDILSISATTSSWLIVSATAGSATGLGGDPNPANEGHPQNRPLEEARH
jgi:hypothetical protein